VRVNHAAAVAQIPPGPYFDIDDATQIPLSEAEPYQSPEPENDDTHAAQIPPEPEPELFQPRSPKPKPRPSLSKEELLELIDPYDDEEIGPVDSYLEYLRDPYMRGYADADTAKVTFARTAEDFDYPSLEQVIEAGEEEQKTLWELRFAVLSRLRNPHKVNLDDIHELYQRLPEPRMLYIHARFRHQLLRVLGQPNERDSGSMLRYFSIIGDVKNTGIPLTTAEWNCGIAFASKYVGRARETEIEAALMLWREMECQANIKGTDVTFNILFDVATKAGNFGLAEMIYREMESRGHRYNRYHYTSLIHFFGLKHDTSGMRAAYKEMVNAGEIIDTVVLNAMISGLLRSGEEAAAERLYERMKALSLGFGASIGDDGDSTKIPVRTPSSDRAITQALLMFAKLGRRHPAMQPTLQQMALVAPDLQTYRILSNHFGVKRGDLAKVAAYVDEMKFFKIPLHHAIFLALFKGFARHGGYARSPWSEQRLAGIWSALLQALDSGAAGELEIRTWLAVWTLRAFARCSTQDRVLDVYDELKARWSLSHSDEQFMIDFLAGLVDTSRL
jgi:pentatricopeptide repeat protein